MSKKTQTTKNIELTQKLLDYLSSNKIRKGYSFVVFSKDDQKLNKANEKLASDLQKKGTKIVKAKETDDKKDPWHLSYLQ